MEICCKIPLGKIKRIELYQNVHRKYMDQIKEQTGADYIINGGIYDFTTFKPFCNVKCNGVVASDPHYTEWGYAWNRGSDISYEVLPNKAANYIGCVASVLNKQKQKLKYNPDMGGTRQRSAIGMANGALILYACNGSASKTPEVLQSYMIANGWESGVMLDGGGSTQMMAPGKCLKSPENNGRGRKVQNYILVYTETDGNKCCPYAEPKTLIKSGSRGEGAKWVQWHLNEVASAHVDVDGIIGSKSVEAIKRFQCSHGLNADGMCGDATRAALKAELKK